MGRLVDTDSFAENLIHCSGLGRKSFELVLKALNAQPTAYDVEKVEKQLEQQAEQYRKRGFEHEQKGFYAMADKYYGKQCSYLHAIEIVKAGGVK